MGIFFVVNKFFDEGFIVVYLFYSYNLEIFFGWYIGKWDVCVCLVMVGLFLLIEVNVFVLDVEVWIGFFEFVGDNILSFVVGFF